jgi:3-oxoacyl-[acyl-carrier-protein] synthase II
MDVVVTGIGLVSALGKSLEASWLRLVSSKSAIGLHQPFAEIAPRPLALIGNAPAEFKSLTQLVVSAALEDAGLVPPLPDCGVVIGSSRSCQASWEKLARRLYQDYPPRPAFSKEGAQGDIFWLDSLPHMGAIAAARQIGSTGTVLAPMAACATGIWAIAQGYELIKTGQCDRAIAGAIEAPITPLTLAGFNQMGALAQTGAYPFDRHREGLVLGEGGAVFVLESAELALRRSARVYGQVLGAGLTADAYHPNTPEPGAKSAIAAVSSCLKRSSLSLKEINYIHAHGTATNLNDRTEAQLIGQMFPQGVPISSTKGATGHTLGASGALGVAFCLMALEHQTLPPCVGLKEAEFELDLVTAARPAEIQNVLCFSFGFGGQNAVLAVGKGTTL